MDKEYYLATKIGKDTVIYSSKRYKLSEMDILNLIKICIVERRNKDVGKRIMEIYEDSTEHRDHITQERLVKLGIKENGSKKPSSVKNARRK